MISDEKLRNYAENFLESEIREIGIILEENISDNDRKILTRLKGEYEADLRELQEDEY